MAGDLVQVAVGDRLRELCAERLLVAASRRPDTDAFAIESTGVARGPHGEVRVDEALRTSVPHIFAAGDVIGGQLATG